MSGWPSKIAQNQQHHDNQMRKEQNKNYCYMPIHKRNTAERNNTSCLKSQQHRGTQQTLCLARLRLQLGKIQQVQLGFPIIFAASFHLLPAELLSNLQDQLMLV